MNIAYVAAAGGLPQLDFSTWPSQIFWLAVTLVALYLIFSRLTLPRIAATMEEREDTILSDLDMAAEFDQKAKEAEAAYNAALEAARAEARQIADDARASIQAELDKAIAAADERIAAKTAESAKRLGEIQAEARDSASAVARELTEALIGKLSPSTIDASQVQSVVAERIAGGRFGG